MDQLSSFTSDLGYPSIWKSLGPLFSDQPLHFGSECQALPALDEYISLFSAQLGWILRFGKHTLMYRFSPSIHQDFWGPFTRIFGWFLRGARKLGTVSFPATKKGLWPQVLLENKPLWEWSLCFGSTGSLLERCGFYQCETSREVWRPGDVGASCLRSNQGYLGFVCKVGKPSESDQGR